MPVQLAGSNDNVAISKVSQTGGSAEDDVNAIVDAAEEAADDGERPILFGLSARASRAKARKMKRATRAALRREQRTALRASRKPYEVI